MRARVPHGPAEDAGDDLARPAELADVSDIWRIFSARRRVIFIVTAICSLAGLGYALLAPQQYKATAQILIDPRDRQIVVKDVNPNTLASDGGVLQVESQAKTIESDAVLLRAVDSAGLDRDPEFGGQQSSFLLKLLDWGSSEDAESERNAQRNKALRELRKNLTIKRADKVFVIDVTVAAKTAEKAARISDAVADAYIADQIAARGTNSRQASDALASRLGDLRGGVLDAENKVEQFKAKHDIVGTNKELLSDLQLDDSGTKLANAHAKSQELRARLDQIETLRRSGGDAGSIPEAISSTVISQLRSSAQELERRASDLRTRVGPRHPDLIAVAEQVQEVRRQIATELDRLGRSARSDYDRALAYEKSLNGNLDKSKLKTLAVGQESVELHELIRELEARRSLYETFLARAAETKAQADIDTLNARIISKAIPPNKASWPPRPFVVLGAIGGGIGLGAGLALLLEFFAPTILSPRQLEGIAGAPVIGTLRSQDGRPSPVPRPSGLRRPAAARPFPQNSDQNSDNEIVLALSRLCGPLGTLRGIPEPYCLLLISADGDGIARMQTAARIVAVAEDRGIAVLLVDTARDAMNGGGRGFFDVVNGRSSINAVVEPYGRKGTQRLGLGHASGAALRDLGDAQVDQFLVDAGTYFDLVVFDGGSFARNPALPALASRADDVLLVAVQGVTSQQAARDMSHAVFASSGQPVSASLLMQAAA